MIRCGSLSPPCLIGSLLTINKLLPFTVDRRKSCALQGELLSALLLGNAEMLSETVMVLWAVSHTPEYRAAGGTLPGCGIVVCFLHHRQFLLSLCLSVLFLSNEKCWRAIERRNSIPRERRKFSDGERLTFWNATHSSRPTSNTNCFVKPSAT